MAAAIADVSRLLGCARHPWWIIGSGAVALHGADAGEVHDIDVLIDPADAVPIFARAGVVPLVMRPDPLFRSDIFARWHGTVLPVEIMAGFSIAGPHGWSRVQPTTRQAVALSGETAFVPSQTDLIALLRRMGRTKDMQRAAALAERKSG